MALPHGHYILLSGREEEDRTLTLQSKDVRKLARGVND